MLTHQTLYRFDDLTVECEDFRVQKDGQNLTFTPRAFDVLLFLVRNAGRVVEKQEIFDHVWKQTFVSDNALTKIIKEIRHVLADDAHNPRYIETVPKRGYRFIADSSEPPTPLLPEEGWPKAGVVRAADGIKAFQIPKDKFGNENPRPKTKDQNYGAARILVALIVIVGLCIAVALLLFHTPHRTVAQSVDNVPIRLTNNPADDYLPVWSPDGKKIAFTSYRDGNTEIYTMNPDGGDLQNLTQNSAFDEFPEWSPDGKKIAFRSKRQRGINKIYVMDADGGNVRRITDIQGKRVTWSPDGKHLVYNRWASGAARAWP